MKPEANTSSYLFHIEGVRCHSCIGKIEAVKNLDDSILSAHMYFGQSLLQTTVKAGVDFKKIEDLILKIGFKAQYLQKESESF